MKNNEERYLKESISKVRSFAKKNPSLKMFYKNINQVELRSIQDLSFKNDIKFFQEVKRILSIITSIISNPIITNKGEHVVVRAASASGLTPYMFIETIKDASLWKRQNLKMVPEYVHYRQYVDEIKIYENIFIVHLVNMIFNELLKYQRFYIRMIQSYEGQESLSLDSKLQEKAMIEIDQLFKFINRIKGTYFYRIINKDHVRLTSVVPNNALLHNHLYNDCFKFYRRMISYSDESLLNHEFYLYYYVLILKQLKIGGFSLFGKKVIKEDSAVKQKALNLEHDLVFFSQNMKITLSFLEEKNAFLFRIMNKLDKQTNDHLLIVDKDDSFENALLKVEDVHSYTTIEAISLWGRAYLEETVKYIKTNLLSEQKMVEEYFLERYKSVSGSEKIYSKFCPICSNKTVSEDHGIYQCANCHSIYKIYPKKNEEAEIMFLRLRRANN